MVFIQLPIQSDLTLYIFYQLFWQVLDPGKHAVPMLKSQKTEGLLFSANHLNPFGSIPRGLPRLSSLRRKPESRKEYWIPGQARNDT